MSETTGETGGQLRIMRSELDELQAHAERQLRQQARYAKVWYYADLVLGLPAVVLAAVSGAVGLTSADGRVPAAFLAIASAALAAATRFLDCAGRGAHAARRRNAWRGLIYEVKLARISSRSGDVSALHADLKRLFDQAQQVRTLSYTPAGEPVPPPPSETSQQ
ncbi:hypothetical protein [Nonomuraea sp. B19D2]|uniref:hypothetical protein n=1 Tax=Nonomuraea sp. B19D2 TaxID=3159561 RepID=UPI0032DB0E26